MCGILITTSRRLQRRTTGSSQSWLSLQVPKFLGWLASQDRSVSRFLSIMSDVTGRFKILMSALNFDAEKVKVTDKLSNNNRVSELACTTWPCSVEGSEDTGSSFSSSLLTPREALLPQFCGCRHRGWVYLSLSTTNGFSASDGWKEHSGFWAEAHSTCLLSPAPPASPFLSICCSFPRDLKVLPTVSSP